MNTLNEDLKSKIVIFRQDMMKVTATEHPFRVDGGFGASPRTQGTALVGEFLSDGERCRMEGYMVDRYATDEEVEDAKARCKEGQSLEEWGGLEEQEASS